MFGGLLTVQKGDNFSIFCIKKQAGMILLQETHSTKKIEKMWQKEWGGNIYYSHGSSNARGVCIMFKPGSKYKIKGKVIDEDGRLIALQIKLDEIDIAISNVYAPNEDSSEFFEKVRS